MKRAVVVGFDYFARFLADLVNEHSSEWRLTAFSNSRIGTTGAFLALHAADALISFGGPSPNSALTEAARRRGIPIFVIWAGSDVLKAKADPFELEITKQEGFINLSVATWLADELREIGVHAEYLPMAAVPSDDQAVPLPASFRVLTYLPHPRRDFYGAPLVFEVARSMPGVSFTVVGAGGRSPQAPANVEFCGLVSDMQHRIDASTVLLRQPEHDGKSMLVLEALARARHVVWNYEFPGVIAARGADQVRRVLEALRAQHDAGTLGLNLAGRDYVLARYRRPNIAAAFEARLNRGLATTGERTRKTVRRVAISGLGLFCAEVAQNVKQVTPQWEPFVMRTNSRLDVLTSIYTLARSDVWYSIGSPITDRWLHLASRVLRKPHVVHWVGSDIAALAEQPAMRALLSSPSTFHLAEVEWTAAQLREQGLHPRIAPLPPRHHRASLQPLPDVFTVMLYVPRWRAEFYGSQSFANMARRLAGEHIRYIVVGGGEFDAPSGVAVENLGWKDNLESVYERATVLIRNTPRDGLSLMVLEALLFGRYVLWTQDFPYTQAIHGYAEMEREVCRLLDAHRRGELAPQAAASEMVRTRYDSASCTRALAQAWEDATHWRTAGGLTLETP